MTVEKKTEKQTSSWISEIEKYSRQIWSAGLDVCSKVSKSFSEVSNTPVKDGEKAEERTKNEVDKQIDAVKDGVVSKVDSAKSKFDEVKDKAIGKWSELEEAFDKRLSNAISRLDIPSRNELKVLNDKVDSLTRQLEKITGISAESVAKPAAKVAPKSTVNAATKAAAKPKPAAKAAAKPAAKTAAKPVAAKSAAKPAAAKKPAAKKSAAPKVAASKPATTAAAPATPTTSS